MRSLSLCLLLSTFILFAYPLFAQQKSIEIERKTVHTSRLQQNIKIDGSFDEASWQSASMVTGFTERTPDNGKPQPLAYQTTVKVLYDDTGLYIAARTLDPSVTTLARELKERDQIGNSDFFAVTLNPYNDRQQSMMFVVQASGAQADAKLVINANDDFSWNAVWYSAVAMDAEGWNVEMRIPYSELRFPKESSGVWGVNFISQNQRLQSQYTWNFVDNTTGSFMLYDGEMTGLTNISPPVRLSLLPYFSSYVNHYQNKTTTNINGGMDLKYGLSDAFTLDVTLIPDFGQANFDESVLNLGPFEQQFEENRSFFTEGTELFNKGDLFYSRRVGGRPSTQPQISGQEQVVENPEKVKLFNAVKISGRTKKGLGIGLFNGITEKMQAVLYDPSTKTQREVVTEPWSNYNVLVLDQRFGSNSSVSLVNTNVLREGNFRDANVTALLADITDRTNTWNYFGNLKQSIVRNGEATYGTEALLGAGKVSGEHRYNASVNLRTKEYNIDDLGFTGGNNFISYFGNYSYRILKPSARFNNLSYNLKLTLTNRLEPALYSIFSIHQTLSFTDKKFQNYGMGLLLHPYGQNNIYEPRTFGRHLRVPAMVNPWIFYNSDERKKFSYGGYTEIYVYDQSGRVRYVSELNARLRLSERFSVGYEFDYDIHLQDQGFVSRENTQIYMGERDIHTFVNTLSSQYAFNEKMSLSLDFRHYYSGVSYEKFFTLNQDGSLKPSTYGMNHDGSSNFWNIDLRYSWWFAPGSQLTLLYRNAAENYLPYVVGGIKDNFDAFFQQPMLNNLSLKITYFLDYNRIKQAFKK